MNIFQETWDEYCLTIGKTPESNRLRPNVECRAAFANACNPFFHHTDIASLFDMDRTTIYHYLRSHETYYRFSADYREWFNAATQVVADKVELVDLNDLSEEAKNKIGAHEQIDSISATIQVLQKVLGKIEKGLRGRKPSQSLQDSGKGSVSNDAGHLGDRLVHRVLRDEQFQVPDESRKETGTADGARPSEGAVVREPSN